MIDIAFNKGFLLLKIVLDIKNYFLRIIKYFIDTMTG
jgi:hypothetical protein